MLVTTHVLSGALLGFACRHPVVAFGAGVASHFALDALPHWGAGDDAAGFLRVAVRDGLVGAGAMAVITAVAPPALRWRLLAGMVGAALPDLDKPSRLFFGFSPFPAAVDDFHGRIQREAPHRLRQEVLVALGAAVAVGALVRATAD